jgi:hypothetical protein
MHSGKIPSARACLLGSSGSLLVIPIQHFHCHDQCSSTALLSREDIVSSSCVLLQLVVVVAEVLNNIAPPFDRVIVIDFFTARPHRTPF